MRGAHRVDWFRVLADLKRCGITFTGIRQSIGIPESTLKGYKTGSEPRHADGEQLVALWCRVMDMPREQIPVERVFMTAAQINRSR